MTKMTSTPDPMNMLERIEKLERRFAILADRLDALEQRPASTTKAAPELSGPDGALYMELLSWRAEKAAEIGKPVYVVFTAEAAAAVAQQRPTNSYELTKVKGFGTSRVDAYGADILMIVQRHSEVSSEGEPW